MVPLFRGNCGRGGRASSPFVAWLGAPLRAKAARSAVCEPLVMGISFSSLGWMIEKTYQRSIGGRHWGPPGFW
eukprot:scaffold3759_cov119-Isochrysis_galbana.AAC.5